jgi:hypothetical protein
MIPDPGWCDQAPNSGLFPGEQASCLRSGAAWCCVVCDQLCDQALRFAPDVGAHVVEVVARSGSGRRSARSMVSSTVRTARVTAELVWFLASATRRADPYPAYARLRRLDPVHHSPIGVWLVSSHEEVSQLLRDPRLSSNEKHIDLDTLHLGPLRRLLGRADATETGAFFDRTRPPPHRRSSRRRQHSHHSANRLPPSPHRPTPPQPR